MPPKAECLDLARSGAIGDMLNYRRVLNNQTKDTAANELGIPLPAYEPLERNRRKAVPVSLLPVIERFIGFDPNTLVDHAEQVVFVQKQAEGKLGEELVRTKDNNSSTMADHLRLRRGYKFYPESKYYHAQWESTLYTPDLPYVQIKLVHTNLKKLERSRKIRVVEEFVTAPFNKVITVFRAKK